MAEIHPQQLHCLAKLILDGFLRNAKLSGNLFNGKVTLPAQFEHQLAACRKLVYFFLEGAVQVIE